MKPFSKWKIFEVEKEFQVKQQNDYALLNEWLRGSHESSGDAPPPIDRLAGLQKRLIKHVHDWNEQELKMRFISPILDMIDFEQSNYQPFFEREISIHYKDEKLSGEVDFIVAQGLRVPEQPYFFIHEHKKEADSSGDPLGQVMIAMVVAQMLNETAHPVYGAYIVGRLWHFVVLNGKEYAVSLAYDATREHINDIYDILMKVKAIINHLAESKLGHSVE